MMGVDVPHSPYLIENRIRRINNGRYERQEVEGALALINEKDRIIELGAGLGVVGAVVNKNCNPARHVAYEANPDLIPHIRALYRANGLSRRITLKNELLISSPDRPETLPFVVRRSFLGSSLLADESRALNVVDVKTAGFAEVAAKLKPTILLMDIEGAELDLLQNIDFDAFPHIRGIVIEFHPKQYEVRGMRICKRVLRQAGFEKMDDVSTRTIWAAKRETS